MQAPRERHSSNMEMPMEKPMISDGDFVKIDHSPVRISADDHSFNFKSQNHGYAGPASRHSASFVPVPTTPSAIDSSMTHPKADAVFNNPLDLQPVPSEAKQYKVLKGLFDALPLEQRIEWQKQNNNSVIGLPDNLTAWPDKDSDYMNWYAKVVAYAMVEKERSESKDRKMIDLYKTSYDREMEFVKDNIAREINFVKEQVRKADERDEQLEKLKASQHREIMALKEKLKEKDARIAHLEDELMRAKRRSA
ncbi:hypothetical protein BJ508DRAFT_365114 [Ascobolus immersus RN42]|uniref:Uncharacterized protein n=1 Tax=Ascobolus immersus RN42 TaxID=1160509 RepID=A0A3N4I363_ASCIM|nr:hypothetical protein BJ508DRAFT_365114 [Ascobolus immersus RN42]